MTNSHSKTWIVFIALLVGMGGILYGYDIGVVSGALLFIHKSIPMTDTQTGFIVGAVLGGGLLGTLIAGPFADKFGRRTVIVLACVVFIAGVLCILMAHEFVSLLTARLLLGIGIGIVSVGVPLYVAELVPAESRGKYVTFFQLFLTFGIVLAYFVDLLFTPTGNWRGMFAVVLVPAAALLLGTLLLPETPRWLAANNKIEKARKVLSKMHAPVAVPAVLDKILSSLKTEDGGWLELLHRPCLLPLITGVLIAILNQWVGINVFLQYAPGILKAAGLGGNFASMMGSVGIGLLNLIFTFIAMLLVDKVGRKTLLITGVSGVVSAEFFLAIVTGMHLAPQVQGWCSLIGLFVFIVSFAIGPGVVVWLAISELLPTRVRGKGVAIGLFFSSLAGTAISSVFPDLKDVLGMSGTYWICFGFAVLYWLVAWFMLPETKNKTLEEIQAFYRKNQ